MRRRRGGFDFFVRNTAVELSGYYDPSFWEKLILAASVQKSSLRHAVIAIGALHEDFAHKRLMSPTSLAEDRIIFWLSKHIHGTRGGYD